MVQIKHGKNKGQALENSEKCWGQTLGTSRRGFLKSVGAAGLGMGLLGSAPAVHAGKHAGRGKAKNLILLVADGMNTGTLSLANHHSKTTRDRDTVWMQLYREPGVIHSLQETRSANSVVTDSAAAGSAWGIGERINNGAINRTPDGREPVPAWIRALEAGKATGLVTTTRMTHATPACFAVNVRHRSMEDAIAEQYLKSGIDVLLGGGSVHFDAGRREDGKDLFRAFEKAGYDVVRNREELMAASGKKGRLLGSFFESHLPYTQDHVHYAPYKRDVPTLAEMTATALGRLERNPEGFVLMVEGGRVDHAGHANDGPSILKEQLAFDDAIAVARDYLAKDPDTLLIVTTDHGTGGAMLNGVGQAYLDTDEAFARVTQSRHSFEFLLPRLVGDGADLGAIVEAGLGFVPDGQLIRSLAETVQTIRAGSGNIRTLSRDLAPALAEQTGIAFTSQNHTADLVELVAIGPGSEKIPPYFLNYELHGLMMGALGLG